MFSFSKYFKRRNNVSLLCTRPPTHTHDKQQITVCRGIQDVGRRKEREQAVEQTRIITERIKSCSTPSSHPRLSSFSKYLPLRFVSAVAVRRVARAALNHRRTRRTQNIKPI